MVSNRDVNVDTELVKNVSTYLNRSAEAAKLSIPKKPSAVGDSFTGDNDSDDDEPLVTA